MPRRAVVVMLPVLLVRIQALQSLTGKLPHCGYLGRRQRQLGKNLGLNTSRQVRLQFGLARID